MTKSECGSALAAGVNAMLSPKTAVKICQLQVISHSYEVRSLAFTVFQIFIFHSYVVRSVAEFGVR